VLFRAGFNRASFNRSGEKTEFSGAAALSLAGEVDGGLRISPQRLTNISLSLDIEGQPRKKLFLADFGATMNLDATGKGICRLTAKPESIMFTLETQGQPLRVILPPNLNAALSLGGRASGKSYIYTNDSLSRLNLLASGEPLISIYTSDLSGSFGLATDGQSTGRIFTGMEPVLMSLGVYDDRTAKGRAALNLTGGLAAGLKIMSVPTSAGMGLDASSHITSVFRSSALNAGFALDASGTRLTTKYFGKTNPAVMGLDAGGLQKTRLFAVSMIPSLAIGADGWAKLRYFTEAEQVARFGLETCGDAKQKIIAPSSLAALSLGGAGWLRLRYYAGGSTLLNLRADGRYRAQGFEELELQKLNVPPGGELVIDTQEMTVTLNGVDVTKHFSPDSQFFKLKPGQNAVVYSDQNLSRTATITFVWRDLWL
jgi:hypothetical protein